MPRKMTAFTRAERWYNRQVKQGRLRAADYSALTKKMALCYEPATLQANRNAVTDQDLKQLAKQLRAITEFKL